VAEDGRVVAQGPPDEARLLASRLPGSDVPAVEPGAAPTPSNPLASPPAGLLEPPKPPDVAGRTTDVSPLELPGEEVIIEGRAPERPSTPRPEPAAPKATPQDRQAADGSLSTPFTMHSRLGSEVEEILAKKGLQPSADVREYLASVQVTARARWRICGR
jgi:hypothetical protein